MGSHVIKVTNKSKESVTVFISTTWGVRIAGDSLAVTIPGIESIKSFFSKSDLRVEPSKTAVVNEVSIWKFFKYAVGLTGAEWYYITVIRDNDAWEAVCKTPLDCTWIVDDDKIYRQDKRSECERFRKSSKSSIKVTNKTEEAISVVIYRGPLLQVLSNGLLEISSHIRDKYFNEGDVVESKKTKAFQKEKSGSFFSNPITSVISLFNAPTYCVRVIRKRDKRIALCETPLDCTWIVQSHGMWQENTPGKIYKFQ